MHHFDFSRVENGLVQCWLGNHVVARASHNQSLLDTSLMGDARCVRCLIITFKFTWSTHDYFG